MPRILVLALLLIFSCTSLRAQNPKDAEAYFKLGVEQATAADKDTDRKAHIEAAISSFKAAIRLKPTWAEAHNELEAKPCRKCRAKQLLLTTYLEPLGGYVAVNWRAR